VLATELVKPSCMPRRVRLDGDPETKGVHSKTSCCNIRSTIGSTGGPGRSRDARCGNRSVHTARPWIDDYVVGGAYNLEIENPVGAMTISAIDPSVCRRASVRRQRAYHRSAAERGRLLKGEPIIIRIRILRHKTP